MTVPNIFDCAKGGLGSGELNPLKCNDDPGGGDDMLGGYKHIQPTPSLVWVVEHHLGWDPAGIVVRDQADARQLPDEDYTDAGEVMTLTFQEETSGIAWVS